MFWDGLSFLSPKPKPYRSFASFLHPLGEIVWAAVIAVLLTMTVVMFSVSNFEQNTVPDLSLKHWSMFWQAGWYCFGTLIGENVTKDSKSDNAWALRY